MEKIGLVLEGGGLRGAYTAGVLAWFLDHHVEFDIVVGISSGALLAAPFITKDRKTLLDLGVIYAGKPDNVGLKPMLREGTPVGYNFLFDTIINQQLKLEARKVRDAKTKMEIGVYDMSKCETIWLTNKDLDDRWQFVKAACTLPIAGRSVKIKGKRYMDGGLTTMIPIFRSEEHGCDRHVVITTKDISFVRKPNHPMLQVLLDLIYLKYPKMLKDFRKRTQVYYDEKAKVEHLVEENRALLIRPSKNLGVKRFSGDVQKLQALFDLAYEDCESQKGQILEFMERKLQ